MAVNGARYVGAMSVSLVLLVLMYMGMWRSRIVLKSKQISRSQACKKFHRVSGNFRNKYGHYVMVCLGMVSCLETWQISRVVMKPQQIYRNTNLTKTKEAISAVAKAEEKKRIPAANEAKKDAVEEVISAEVRVISAVEEDMTIK